MSNPATAVRQWVEGLALGTGGSGYSIASERFHALAPDCTIQTHPADSVERAIEIDVDGVEPLMERNHYDGFVLRTFVVKVSVGYLYTRAGGDNAEGLTEQHGEATINAIKDRACVDHFDLMRVFSDPDNRALASPAIIAMIAEETYELEVLEDRIVMSFALQVQAQVSTTATLAP